MRNLAISVCALLLLGACTTTPKVYTDFDPKQDFSSYKTFSWVTESPALVAGNHSISAITKSRMTQAIKDKLISMGYEFTANPEQADFTLLYTIGARDKIRISEYPVHHSFYRDGYLNSWGRYYSPYFIPMDVVYEQKAYEYVQAEISIDIFDGKTRHGVWHAMASKRLSSEELRGNGEDPNIAVQALFAEFPSR